MCSNQLYNLLMTSSQPQVHPYPGHPPENVEEEFSGVRSCKKTDSYQFETEIDIGSKKSFSETCYTPSSRNCKKTDSYEFEDEDFS